MDQTIKIEAGHYYKLRDGRRYRCYATENTRHGFIHGAYLLSEGAWLNVTHYSNGQYMATSSSIPNAYDIVAEWKDPIKVAGWVNVYNDADGVFIFYLSKEEADQKAAKGRVACIYVVGEET